MADIRQTTDPLDDFNRPAENPLSHGGDWSTPVAPSSPTVWDSMLLKDIGSGVRVATQQATKQFGFAYWNKFTMSNDDQEVWARARGGNASGTGWRLGLLKDVSGASNIVDGYLLRFDIGTGGGSCQIRRYTNGGFTTIVSSSASPPTGNPGYLLLRRSGTHVQFWANTVAGDPSNWTLYLDVVDTTYMTGLYGAIGTADNSRSQICSFGPVFGAGPAAPFLPQFYRRPSIVAPV